jgi:hypothetical protein
MIRKSGNRFSEKIMLSANRSQRPDQENNVEREESLRDNRVTADAGADPLKAIAWCRSAKAVIWHRKVIPRT